MLKVVILGFILAGTFATISVKWMDKTQSAGLDGAYAKFAHPFIQSVSMFVGESLCLVAWYFLRPAVSAEAISDAENLKAHSKPKNPHWKIFIMPAIADYFAVSLTFFALNLTYASMFQMLRGSVIVFTALLAVIWLRRRLFLHHWIGVSILMAGLFLVGVSASLVNNELSSANNHRMMWGNLLVVIAQIAHAIQVNTPTIATPCTLR
eukprot:TRINITY_DN4730_c0_g1_i3.p1 TRINITY_DN4730_c0_g1~~TRINITY_DN4730_c0_g1_i3.p1  ORF type:complete len:208 (+),score=33.87 TRINITY_DN4730_c0_g1_i3:75-698(+)